MSLLTDELKSWIGREAHYPAREELGRARLEQLPMRGGLAALSQDSSGRNVAR